MRWRLPIERLEAVLFDFDGLIIDSETPGYRSWNEVYRVHGAELPLAEWAKAVGTLDGFDPVSYLVMLSGGDLDRQALVARREARKNELVSLEEARPGVAQWMAEFDRRAVPRGIVSSGHRDWIERHLQRLGLDEGWACISSADGNRALAKPSPHLYRVALEVLGVHPRHALAFEDSPNGIAAAKGAGLWCVCVPNQITVNMDLGGADMIVASLTDLELDDRPSGLSARGGTRTPTSEDTGT